jgi:hypothetical protein
VEFVARLDAREVASSFQSALAFTSQNFTADDAASNGVE